MTTKPDKDFSRDALSAYLHRILPQEGALVSLQRFSVASRTRPICWCWKAGASWYCGANPLAS